MSYNHKLYIHKIIVFSLLFCMFNHYARESDQVEHIWKGNLALPASQQPGSLVGLGQNIVDKNDLLIYMDYNYSKNRHQKYTIIAPSILYGLTNISSLFIRIPIATKLKVNNKCSSGIGDVTVQYEYAFFNKDESFYGIQATALANIGFPTGSFKKEPHTGFGSTSFFLGTTISYTSILWYSFACAGVTLTTSQCGNKHGNQYLYQCGFGRNIGYRSKKWILTSIIELDGYYDQHNIHDCISDKNSGGNTIMADYTLWFSTKKLVVIGSISTPIQQHLFGKQNKTEYFLLFTLGWKFNG